MNARPAFGRGGAEVPHPIGRAVDKPHRRGRTADGDGVGVGGRAPLLAVGAAGPARGRPAVAQREHGDDQGDHQTTTTAVRTHAETAPLHPGPGRPGGTDRSTHPGWLAGADWAGGSRRPAGRGTAPRSAAGSARRPSPPATLHERQIHAGDRLDRLVRSSIPTAAASAPGPAHAVLDRTAARTGSRPASRHPRTRWPVAPEDLRRRVGRGDGVDRLAQPMPGSGRAASPKSARPGLS